MGTSGNRDCQWASRSVLKDFTEDALTISAGNLFQNGTVRIMKANWRRRVQHLCWWNLHVTHLLVLVLASAFTRGGLSRHHQSR